ncbi:MAG: PaaI family thioesterase [Bacillota bacterium]
MEIADDNMCFACGRDNPISLGLKFEFVGKNTVEASFIPGKVHQGFKDIMHGGLITTLLDESMAKVLSMQGISAVTAEMKIRFKKPVHIGEKLSIKGSLKKKRGRLIFTEARAEDEQGQIRARAEAKFMVAG